jgi:hypothetical protein
VEIRQGLLCRSTNNAAKNFVGWAKHSVPTILSAARMVGTAQARLCPPYDILRDGLLRCARNDGEIATERDMADASACSRTGVAALQRRCIDNSGVGLDAPCVANFTIGPGSSC